MAIEKATLMQTIDSLPVPTILFDASLQQPIAANLLALELVDLAATEFHNFYSKFYSQISPEDKKTFEASFKPREKPTKENYLPWEIEYKIQKPSGEEIDILDKRTIAYVANLQTGKEEKILVCTLQDVTQSKQQANLLARLRQSIAEESQYASIGRLIAGISHEINNPLAIIKGWAENIPSMPESLDTAVGKIVEASNRISRIVAATRLLALPPALITEQELSIKEVFEDLALLLKTQFAKHNVKLRTEVAENTKLIICRKQILERILLSLIQNALEALILVTNIQKSVTLSAVSNEEFLIIRVLDNGPGICPKNAAKIFDPFFTTTHSEPKAGLGLTTALFLAKTEQWDLSLEPSEIGSCFALKVPALGH